MKVAKYFWDLKGASLAETEKVLKDPEHPQFPAFMARLLSRCDRPREVFSVLSRKKFIGAWPRVRSYWVRHTRQSDSREWWETLYEQLVEPEKKTPLKAKGGAPALFQRLGLQIREARMAKGLSQKELAFRTGMKQPDISRVEEGRKNITLFTLMRLGKVLEIKTIEVNE